MTTEVAAAVIATVSALLIASLTWLGRVVVAWRDENRRRRHIMTALRSEIADKVAVAQTTFDRFDVDSLCDRMESDATYVPYFTIEPYSAPIFESTIHDLPHLPADVVRVVVDFYRWDRVTHSAFDSMRSTEFAALDASRRSLVLRSSATVLADYLAKGNAAETAIERHA